MSSRVVPLAAAALLAGCGGTSGQDLEAPEQTTGLQQSLDAQNAYDNGLDTCSQYPLKELAGIYGTKQKPEPVARAVAANQQTTPELRDHARRGCLAALQKSK